MAEIIEPVQPVRESGLDSKVTSGKAPVAIIDWVSSDSINAVAAAYREASAFVPVAETFDQ